MTNWNLSKHCFPIGPKIQLSSRRQNGESDPTSKESRIFSELPKPTNIGRLFLIKQKKENSVGVVAIEASSRPSLIWIYLEAFHRGLLAGAQPTSFYSPYSTSHPLSPPLLNRPSTTQTLIQFKVVGHTVQDSVIQYHKFLIRWKILFHQTGFQARRQKMELKLSEHEKKILAQI